MGNSCPSGFQLNPAMVGSCVPQCPSEKGFEFRLLNGVPHCVHVSDATLNVQLIPLPGFDVKPNEAVPTVEQLATSPNIHMRRYKADLDRFNQAIPALEERINKAKEVQDAFKALQDAENARDTSPDLYQEARVRYYTLLKGDTWKQEESERVGKAEADPLLNKYRANYTDLLNQIDKQQKTLEVVQGVKNKVMSLRDDLDYSVSTFGKQIKDIRNQINIDRAHPKEDPYFWLNFMLNAILVLFGIGVAIVLIGRLRAVYSQGSVFTSSGNAMSNLS